MSDPTCRICYIRSLPAAQAQRVQDAPITMPVHYCEAHRWIEDGMPSVPMIDLGTRTHEGRTFPRYRAGRGSW